MSSLFYSVMCRYKGQAPDLLGKQDSVYEGTVYYEHRSILTVIWCNSCFLLESLTSNVFFGPTTEDWDMLDVDEDEKLTGEEEFELLAGPLGLNERRIVPEAVQFPDSDPLGASVAMVTATNSMEETLLQIGEVLISLSVIWNNDRLYEKQQMKKARITLQNKGFTCFSIMWKTLIWDHPMLNFMNIRHYELWLIPIKDISCQKPTLNSLAHVTAEYWVCGYF